MADGHGIINSNGGDSMRDGDLEEEEVWAVLKKRSSKDSSPKVMRKAKDSSGSSSSSVPVNIPDWSKIYRRKKKNGLTEEGSWVDNVDDKNDGGYHACVDDGYDDDDDVDEMVPPHEYIAKKLARSQISSFSMCEGIGRTLKGRDLSKVRNAILTKTGFLESSLSME